MSKLEGKNNFKETEIINRNYKQKFYKKAVTQLTVNCDALLNSLHCKGVGGTLQALGWQMCNLRASKSL